MRGALRSVRGRASSPALCHNPHVHSNAVIARERSHPDLPLSAARPWSTLNRSNLSSVAIDEERKR